MRVISREASFNKKNTIWFCKIILLIEPLKKPGENYPRFFNILNN